MKQRCSQSKLSSIKMIKYQSMTSWSVAIVLAYRSIIGKGTATRSEGATEHKSFSPAIGYCCPYCLLHKWLIPPHGKVLLRSRSCSMHHLSSFHHRVYFRKWTRLCPVHFACLHFPMSCM